MAYHRGLSIPLDNLRLYFDADNKKSYPGSGTTFFDISGYKNNGTLQNGPSFSSGNISSILFDASDDIINVSTSSYSQWSIVALLKCNLQDFVLNSSTRNIFYNIPPSGSSAEGYLRIADDLFYNVNTCYIDSGDNIYGGGQYGGYNSTVASTITKISSSGSLICSFASPTHTGGSISCNYIHEYNNQIFYGGTNLGQLGLTVVDKTTGLTTGITQTSGASGGSTSICSYAILDIANNYIYIMGNLATTYQSTNVSGGLVKLNLSDRTIVSAFDTSTGFTSASQVSMGVLDANGDLYVVGDFATYKGSSYPRIVKINKTDATIDASFNPGTGFNAVANWITIDSNGKLLVGGNFTSYNNTSINRIVRLNTDGTIDNTFNPGSGFTSTQVRRIKIDSNGKLIVVGDFTSFNGVTTNRIVRLNSDGSRDNTFSIGTGFNNNVTDVGFTTTGKLIVVGNNFTDYNGNTTPASICRLNDDGTYDSTFNPAGFNMPLYRGRLEVRLAGGTVQNNFGGVFGISTGRNVFSVSPGSYLWNNYNHIVITFSSDKSFRFYRNGTLTTTLAATGSANCNMSLNQLFFRDNLYLFKFYSKALSLSEIRQSLNAVKNKYRIS
jgi:hypothetical protein